ncbi:MAG: nucleotide-binding universal stress UspA family protein [Halovenus sp.]|jgi:nucleotide-binding universal stress UspA family protein
MGSRVLVPYDGSEGAQYALSHALHVFDPAAVSLLYVAEPAGDSAARESDSEQSETGQELLEATRRRYDPPDRRRIEPVVRYGRPVDEILGCIDDSGIDHVVVGSQGRNGATQLLLGSVAEAVVRRSPVPVTVVREPTAETPPGRVLVPFDASGRARDALTAAFDLFPEADVTALYVSTLSAVQEGTEAILGALNSGSNERQDHTESVLGTAKELATARGRTLGTESVTGDPATAIVEYAGDRAVDHIVVGPTERDGITRLLLGSVAETVVRRSPVTTTITT